MNNPFNLFDLIPVFPYFLQYITLYSEKDKDILQRGRFRERLLLVGI